MPTTVKENPNGNMTATTIRFEARPDVEFQVRMRSRDLDDQLEAEIRNRAWKMGLMVIWGQTPDFQIIEQFSYNDAPVPVSDFMPESAIDADNATGHYNLNRPDVP